MSAQLFAGVKKKRKELPQSTIDAYFTSKTDTPNTDTDTDKVTSQQEGGTLEHDLA